MAKELLRDLSQQAAGGPSLNDECVSEATYQLSVVHYEGHVVEKDIEKALHWLEIAALRGSRKAVSSCTPIFASLGRAMSEELKTYKEANIRREAEYELAGSFGNQFSNTLSDPDTTVALRQWAGEHTKDYEAHVASPEFSYLYGTAFQVASIVYARDKEGDSFDSGLVDNFNVFYHGFQASDRERFVHLVQQHGILEKPSSCGLTMLQIAASKGDMELARTLVTDLGAEVDAVGATKGMTPLWISCFSGHIDMASYLVDRGADPRCRDGHHGRTIAHFFNRCRSPESLVTLAALSARAGLSLDERDFSGNTPLLSTFIGWDFSRGLAARWLIQQQVDVLTKSDEDWSCLAAATRCLDVDLIKTILGAMETSAHKAESGLIVPDLSIGDAKKEAFEIFFTRTEFHMRCFHGRDATAKLDEIVNLILDSDMIDKYCSSEASLGTNPLVAACFAGKDDLAVAVLRAAHCPDINQASQDTGMTALHWAVEHGRTQTALELLRRGSDPLIADREGLNSLHRSSRFSPALLVEMVDRMEAGEFLTKSDRGVKDILSIPTSNEETVFSILVIEGTARHLEVAELLRIRYDLDYNSFSISPDGEKASLTLTAYMIYAAVSSNLFTLRQVEYLLTLSPRPAFVADSLGATLMHYAVRNWQYGK